MDLFILAKEVVDLTVSEQKLLDYIITFPHETMNLKVEELCIKAYVSKPTVYRLCKKLHINGYLALKLALAKSLEKSNEIDVDYNYPFFPKQTNFKIIDNLQEIYNQTVSSTKELIHMPTLQSIIKEMHQAKHIKVFPSVGNAFMADSFRTNMQEIGCHVEVSHGLYDQMWAAANATRDDIVFVASYLGKTANIEKLLLRLRQNHAVIVLLSSPHEHLLAKYATYRLAICPHEHFQEKIASFSSRISLQFLYDTLYSVYFNQNYDKNLRFRIENYTD